MQETEPSDNRIHLVKVEHAICDLKHYKIIGTLWRHPRRKLKKIVELCGAFVRRRQTLFY
jgi:hypothetical protein